MIYINKTYIHNIINNIKNIEQQQVNKEYMYGESVSVKFTCLTCWLKLNFVQEMFVTSARKCGWGRT